MTQATQQPTPVMHTDLPLKNKRQGKVRDIYQATLTDSSEAMVIIASDRISAFDVVMPNPVPGKGIVLTQISSFWFQMIQETFGHQLNHHLIGTDPSVIQGLTDEQIHSLRGRTMVCKPASVVPIECVVRGYLAGSGWKEYQANQTVCGVKLPQGLLQCDKLPSPIFTPATKADTGHDQNISFEQAAQIAGQDLMTNLRDLSIAIYEMAHRYALQRGIILADTKFEFGLPIDTNLPPADVQPILIDEALTPDSSRFWPADQYEPGRDQLSFDKQYVRNYLQEIVDNGRWNKQPPGPALPDEVVHNTMAKYLDAYRKLTGGELNFQ